MLITEVLHQDKQTYTGGPISLYRDRSLSKLPSKTLPTSLSSRIRKKLPPMVGSEVIARVYTGPSYSVRIETAVAFIQTQNGE